VMTNVAVKPRPQNLRYLRAMGALQSGETAEQ
jgi:hypothetical protein